MSTLIRSVAAAVLAVLAGAAAPASAQVMPGQSVPSGTCYAAPPSNMSSLSNNPFGGVAYQNGLYAQQQPGYANGGSYYGQPQRVPSPPTGQQAAQKAKEEADRQAEEKKQNDQWTFLSSDDGTAASAPGALPLPAPRCAAPAGRPAARPCSSRTSRSRSAGWTAPSPGRTATSGTSTGAAGTTRGAPWIGPCRGAR